MPIPPGSEIHTTLLSAPLTTPRENERERHAPRWSDPCVGRAVS